MHNTLLQISFIDFIGQLIFNWVTFIVVVAVLSFLIWQNYRKSNWASDIDYTLLLLEVPRDNEKRELSAEQMFASLHGILRPKTERIKEGALQEHISFEIVSIGKKIRFFVYTPKQLQNFVEGQIYAQYPTVQIREISEDYATRDIAQDVTYVTEVTLNQNEVLPVKTFPNFEVDPLAGITATLAKLDKGEEMWVQILARPIDDSWHKRGTKFISNIKEGRGGFSSGMFSFIGFFLQFLQALWQPPTENSNGKIELSERQSSQISAVEEKIKKLGYEVKVRISYLGNDRETARLRMQAMVGTFKQFNTTNLNGFSVGKSSYSREALRDYAARLFIDKGYILNIEEMASLYHLPHTNVQTPNIVWSTTKTAEPPSNLPIVGEVAHEELSPMGTTTFRNSNISFGIKRADRGRHLYAIGQTGTGKSYLIELLALSDLFYNHGFGIIDPHGDLAGDMLRYIPEERLEDVIYFNPADMDFPIAFNPLEVTDPNLKNHISSELVGVLKKMFESWGPRLEYILRNTILALLDYPDSTMLDITRMLTDKKFRQEVIDQIEDTVVKNFWTNEFASWNERFQSEAVSPVLNKVGAFTSNPLIRNIVGQPKSTINIRKLMDEGKIFIVNLSRGLVGEDNAAILGALMVTKIQLAAMSRADIAHIEDRRPFYLYVDEFQNFATDSFAVILSEARKYGLYLTVANQYVGQMPPLVRDAVFGNVGSIVSFRVGPEDAPYLIKHFTPEFEGEDLLSLQHRNFIATLSINGEKGKPFSARTLDVPDISNDFTHEIITRSRNQYARSREEVAEMIHRMNEKKNTHSPSKKNKGKSKHKNKKSKNQPDKTDNKKQQNKTISPDETIRL